MCHQAQESEKTPCPLWCTSNKTILFSPNVLIILSIVPTNLLYLGFNENHKSYKWEFSIQKNYGIETLFQKSRSKNSCIWLGWKFSVKKPITMLCLTCIKISSTIGENLFIERRTLEEGMASLPRSKICYNRRLISSRPGYTYIFILLGQRGAMACTKAKREVGPKQRGLDIPVHLIVSSDFVVRTLVSHTSLVLHEEMRNRKKKMTTMCRGYTKEPENGTSRQRHRTLPPKLPLDPMKYLLSTKRNALFSSFTNFDDSCNDICND